MTDHSDYDRALAAFEALDPAHDSLKEFYEAEVLPRAIDRIRALAAARGWRAEPVDVLLLTAGTQPYSLSLSLAITPARFVGFLHTDESFESAQEAFARVLRDATHAPVPRYCHVGATDPVAVYREILAIQRERSPASLVIDVTSGTKAMTAAASSAAMVLQARQRYVESSPLRHSRWHGREQPHELPHPLSEIGDLDRREAARHFDRADFGRAGEMFLELHRRGAPAYRYGERARLAQSYAHADALRFRDALDAFGDDDLSRLCHRGDSLDPLCAQHGRLVRQREFLAELAGGEPADETLIRYLVAYARRRSEQRLFDVAVLVHYRTIELCVAVRLKSHGVDSSGVCRDAIAAAAGVPADEVLQRVNALAGERYRLARWPARLALAQGWNLLAAFDDPLVASVKSDHLFGQIEARNASILVHGRRPITARAFETFVALAVRLRDAAAQLQGWTLPDPDPDFDFVRLGEDEA